MKFRLRPLLVIALLAGCVLARSDQPRDPAAARRADAAFQRGDYAEAVFLYRSFLNSDPDEDSTVHASYRLAASYHRLGRDEEAARVLEDLRAEYPDGQWPVVWALFGDIDSSRGRNVSALLWFERASQVAPESDRGQLSARIAALAPTLSDEEREQARSLVTSDLVRRALDAPRVPRAGRRTDEATATATPEPTPTPGPESARIGLLLPLSGKHRAVGKASLEGARIAAKREVDLLPLDTRATAGFAAAQFSSFADDLSVAAVVGPLRSEEVSAVAPQAESSGLSLLPLSQSEAASGPFVFQMAMTRTLQAQTLAAYAVRRLGVQRFAVVHPRDSYGSRFAELFRGAVQAEGARIIGTVTYQPGQAEFGREIDELRGLNEGGGIGAIFLPDSAATVALLAPEIHREMPQVQLLGSSEWNEAFILAGVARAIEGAIVVDGFYAGSKRPATRAFVEKFRQRYGRVPGLLEAQAHDAVALVEAAVARGAFTRQEVQLMLSNLGYFEGASGILEIGDGIVRRQLFVLRFRDGDLEELSW